MLSYLHLERIKNTNLIPYRKGDKRGFCDEHKNIVVAPEYCAAEPFTDGLGFVEAGGDYGGKYGFVDEAGEVVVPIIYDNAQPFSEGLASIVLEGKFGFGKNQRQKFLYLVTTAQSFTTRDIYAAPDKLKFAGH